MENQETDKRTFMVNEHKVVLVKGDFRKIAKLVDSRPYGSVFVCWTHLVSSPIVFININENDG